MGQTFGQCCAAAPIPDDSIVKPTPEASGDAHALIAWNLAGAGVPSTGAYIIARVGPAGSKWEELPSSGGRRSGTTTVRVNPNYLLAFPVLLGGLKDPEIHIRLYDKDFVGDHSFLAEASATISELPANKVGKEIHFKGIEASVFVSAGEVDLLKKLEVKPSSLFEGLQPVGELKSVKVADITGDFPFIIGKAPLPPVLRGLYWLDGVPTQSALVSFGGPNRDGASCSTGTLRGTEYTIRVLGDRVWSSGQKLEFELLDPFDIIYYFIFDNAENPTQMQIIPEVHSLGWKVDKTWLVDFDATMELKGDPEFPGSDVWTRHSSMLGVNLPTYRLVKVMDEHGKRIEPAWSKFAEWTKGNSVPGEILYHELPASAAA